MYQIYHCMLKQLDYQLYLKEYYSEEPLFAESKIVTSVYNKDFEGSLNEELIEKVKFDKIAEEKINILQQPNYTNVIKSAVINSDAIVIGSDSIPKEITETIDDQKLPLLSHQSGDSFESYLDFYRDIISQD